MSDAFQSPSQLCLNQAIRAASYSRMSTDHQNYSLQHQQRAIDEYASSHGLVITETYVDEGKSGLNLRGRKGLQRLLSDVLKGPNFKVILVYDVSRWGRFQDIDESAYCEIICKHAGVQIIYCAELFPQDHSIFSSFLKYVKRLMAAEYSRELSARVFAAQCTFVNLGFKPGGAAGFGLRRVLVDKNGKSKQVLKHGEKKSISTDRIVFALGSSSEIAIVQRVYKWYVEDGLGYTRIAKLLNSSGLAKETGKPWTRDRVRSLLVSEKYIGNVVFNRISYKLKERLVKNPPEKWIRNENAFEAIVQPEVYAAAQAVRVKRCSKFTDEQLFDILRFMQGKYGQVSARLLDAEPCIPGSQIFRYRFGTMGEAYRRAGIYSERVDHHVKTRRRISEMRDNLLCQVEELIKQTDVLALRTNRPYELELNGVTRLQIQTVRCRIDFSGKERWRIPMGGTVDAHFVLAAQLLPDNSSILCYYLFPASQFPQPYVLLRAELGDEYSAQRYGQLEQVFNLPGR